MRKEFSQKTKLTAFERSGGRCEIEGDVGCGVKIRPGNGPEYHHKDAAYFAGSNDLENCQVLCVKCHKIETRKQRPALEKSRSILKGNANAKSKRGGFRGHRRFNGEIVWKD